MRTCLVVGCREEIDEGSLCDACDLEWEASPESDRGMEIYRLPEHAARDDRMRRALLDWATRIEAERRNGGQP